MSRKSKNRERLALVRQCRDADLIREWERDGNVVIINKESVAYHESAHAIAALRVGWGVTSVDTIRRVVRGAGAKDKAFIGVSVQNGSCALTPCEGAVLGDHWFTLIAGEMAEQRLGLTDIDGTMGDVNQIIKGARAIAHGEADFQDALESIEEMAERVREFITHDGNWAAITEVAERLLIAQKLSGEEVRQILIKHVGEDIAVYSVARYLLEWKPEEVAA